MVTGLHKRSVTIEVMTADEQVLGGGRFATDVSGFSSMLAYVRRWPDRVWAVEGCRRMQTGTSRIV